MRIVLQAGQTFQEPGASAMDEQARRNASIGIAQAMEDLGPAIDAFGVGGALSQSENSVGVLFLWERLDGKARRRRISLVEL